MRCKSARNYSLEGGPSFIGFLSKRTTLQNPRFKDAENERLYQQSFFRSNVSPEMLKLILGSLKSNQDSSLKQTKKLHRPPCCSFLLAGGHRLRQQRVKRPTIDNQPFPAGGTTHWFSWALDTMLTGNWRIIERPQRIWTMELSYSADDHAVDCGNKLDAVKLGCYSNNLEQPRSNIRCVVVKESADGNYFEQWSTETLCYSIKIFTNSYSGQTSTKTGKFTKRAVQEELRTHLNQSTCLDKRFPHYD